MSHNRDNETARLLEESRRLRGRLAAAVSELDAYVAALQDYVDTLHRGPDPAARSSEEEPRGERSDRPLD